MRLGGLEQAPERTHEQLHLLHRGAEDGSRVPRAEAAPDRPLGLQRLAGQCVEVPYHRRLTQAVREDLLSVDDGIGVAEAQ